MLKPEDLERAVDVLRDGGVVAYPTDTVYGLAVDPRSADAVRRLFAVKARQAGHAVPVIAADFEQVEKAAAFDPQSARAARAFWPGPLSLILPGKGAFRPEILAGDGSVAVRVPAQALARALADGLGFCITATSANLSGEPPAATASAVAQSLGDRIDFVLDGGHSPGGAPSTIADLRGGAPRLVRAGAIEWDRVLRSIQ
jgi:L-threonylcarbamoyladenylate synthase